MFAFRIRPKTWSTSAKYILAMLANSNSTYTRLLHELEPEALASSLPTHNRIKRPIYQ
jgi:hypothetical protein